MLYQTDVAGKKSPDGMGNNRSVSSFVLASRRRVAVMVEVRGRGRFPSLGMMLCSRLAMH